MRPIVVAYPADPEAWRRRAAAGAPPAAPPPPRGQLASYAGVAMTALVATTGLARMCCCPVAAYAEALAARGGVTPDSAYAAIAGTLPVQPHFAPPPAASAAAASSSVIVLDDD